MYSILDTITLHKTYVLRSKHDTRMYLGSEGDVDSIKHSYVLKFDSRAVAEDYVLNNNLLEKYDIFDFVEIGTNVVVDGEVVECQK